MLDYAQRITPNDSCKVCLFETLNKRGQNTLCDSNMHCLLQEKISINAAEASPGTCEKTQQNLFTILKAGVPCHKTPEKMPLRSKPIRWLPHVCVQDLFRSIVAKGCCSTLMELSRLFIPSSFPPFWSAVRSHTKPAGLKADPLASLFPSWSTHCCGVSTWCSAWEQAHACAALCTQCVNTVGEIG